MGDAEFLGGARNKAGMPETGGRERQKIDEIIREASRGSKFYEHQQKREQRVREKIERLKAKKLQLEKMFERDHQQLDRTRRELDQWIKDVERERDLTKTIVCVDMDAFFASVETLEHPEWAKIPMAVGGKSMLSTANYEARKYGVVSAMPGYIALKLCPKLLIVEPDFEKYRAAAQKFHAVFRKYDENFSHFSLDEATLDITHLLKPGGPTASEVVEKMRAEVFEASGLTCSAGIAPNKMLAKICSNQNKPNGQFYLENDRGAVLEFIRAARLVKINGIGKVTAAIIEGLLGAATVGQLWEHRLWVRLLFSEIQSDFLLRCCLGIGYGFANFDQDGDRQSMSVERTFSTLEDTQAMLSILDFLCTDLARDLESEGLVGKNVTVKMKASDFSVITRAVTVKRFISSKDDIYQHAKELLVKNRPKDLRLLGVRMSTFEHADNVAPEEDISGFVKKFDSSKLAKCPICLFAIPNAIEDDSEASRRIINDHVDLCLAKSVAQQSSQEEPIKKPPKRKSGSLDAFFKKKPKL